MHSWESLSCVKQLSVVLDKERPRKDRSDLAIFTCSLNLEEKRSAELYGLGPCFGLYKYLAQDLRMQSGITIVCLVFSLSPISTPFSIDLVPGRIEMAMMMIISITIIMIMIIIIITIIIIIIIIMIIIIIVIIIIIIIIYNNK